MLETGITHTSEQVVSPADTALAMGSGDLPVFATPALVALMENAAMLAVSPFLPDDSTTVGGLINASHLAPSPVGSSIRAVATLESMDGRKLTFGIMAYEGEKLIGKATHVRFIVNKEKFMGQLV